jgi:hypothetical protein
MKLRSLKLTAPAARGLAFLAEAAGGDAGVTGHA